MSTLQNFDFKVVKQTEIHILVHNSWSYAVFLLSYKYTHCYAELFFNIMFLLFLNTAAEMVFKVQKIPISIFKTEKKLKYFIIYNTYSYTYTGI